MKRRIRAIFITLIILLSFVHLSFAGSQQTSSTLASTIITNARMYLNDTTATYFNSDAEMLVYLNDGTMDIVARTHCLESTTDKTLQLDTIVYPISSAFIVIKYVLYRSFNEKVTNGTMEADSSWSDEGTPAANERSTTQVYQGTYSRKFTPNAADEGIKSTVFTTVTGSTYYYKLFVYPDDETSVNIYIYKGDGSGSIVDRDVTGLVENGWNTISGSYTETAGGAGAYISIRSPTGITAGDWYVDDVSIYTEGDIKPLLKGSLEHMSGIIPDLGEPAYWTQWANNVYVYPKPNSDAAGKVVRVLFVKRPTAVAAGAAVLVPAYYDKALTLYIAAQALKKDAKYAQSNVILAEYQAELDRYRADFSYQPAKGQID